MSEYTDPASIQHIDMFNLYARFIDSWDNPFDPDLKEALRRSRESFRNESSFDVLHREVSSAGLSLNDVDHDGNCFFHAVLHQIKARNLESIFFTLPEGQVTHSLLRQLAVGGLIVLEQRGELVSYFPDSETVRDQMAAYISSHKRSGAWATSLMIYTLARVLGVTIVLINSDSNKPTVIHGGDRGELYLGYQVGVHFQSTTGTPTQDSDLSLEIAKVKLSPLEGASGIKIVEAYTLGSPSGADRDKKSQKRHFSQDMRHQHQHRNTQKHHEREKESQNEKSGGASLFAPGSKMSENARIDNPKVIGQNNEFRNQGNTFHAPVYAKNLFIVFNNTHDNPSSLNLKYESLSQEHGMEPFGLTSAWLSSPSKRGSPIDLNRNDILSGQGLRRYEQQRDDQPPKVITQPKEHFVPSNAWKCVPLVNEPIGHSVDSFGGQLGKHSIDEKPVQGRLDILSKIDKALSRHTDSLLIDTPKSNLLKGYGGVGKTTLAAWYARSRRKDYEVIVWLQANEPLEKQFEVHARDLFGLTVPDKSTSQGGVNLDVVRSFYATLSQFDRWLVVFDDVKNPKDIARFLPRAHAKETYGPDLLETSESTKKGCLITSRHNDWGVDSKTNIFNVGGFTHDEVCDFLKQNLRKHYTDDEVICLADAFDSHPYALQQATNYINRNVAVSSITKYLEKLEEQAEVIFSDETAQVFLSDDSSYPHNVLKAFSMSSDYFLVWTQTLVPLDDEYAQQLIKKMSLALIACLGYLHPGELSDSLLISIIDQVIDSKDINTSSELCGLPDGLSQTLLEGLSRYGILRREEDQGGCEGESFVLHQLMGQSFHLEKYKQNPEHIHRIILKAFSSGIIYDRFSPKNNPDITPYLKQATYYLDADHSSSDPEANLEQLKLCINLGEYYLFQYSHFDEAHGFFVRAETCLEQVDHADEKAFKEQKSKLFNGMGFISYQDHKNKNKGLDYLRKTLTLWGDSENRLSNFFSVCALRSMGYIKSDDGESKMAKQYYETGLNFLMSTINKSDEAYITELSLIKSALGDYYAGNHEANKALEFYLSAEEEVEKTHPEGHPELHILRDKMVSAYRKEKNYDAAIEQLKKMALEQEKKVGHTIDYLDGCYQMVQCHKDNSQIEEAEKLLNEIFQIIQENYQSLVVKKSFGNTTLLFVVSQFGHLEALELLTKKSEVHLLPEDKQEALMAASLEGHLPVVKHLVSQGASPAESHEQGFTALLFSSAKGHLPVVEWLLDEGGSLMSETTPQGLTALLLAAQEGHLSVVKHLVSQGASPTEGNARSLTPLLFASASGHLPVVEWLLAEGGSLMSETTPQGLTALLLAAQQGHLSMVQWLLSEGKASIRDKDEGGDTALLLAALKGHLPMIQYLLSQGASPTEANALGFTPFLFASAAGHLPVVEWLLAEGGSSIGETAHKGMTALLLAAQQGHLSMVQWLLSEGKASIRDKDEDGDTALLLAALKGHLSVIQYLLSQGALPTEANDQGLTALILAAQQGHLSVLQHLVSQGALPTEANTEGVTPLLIASAKGHLPVVEWLLAEGGSLMSETTSKGSTALLLAAQQGHLSIVQWLLSEEKASIRDKDEDGDTALLLAVRKGHLSMIQYLLSQGASPTEANSQDLTPLLLASSAGHLPVVEWLLSERKASICEKDQDGDTALLLAARQGDLLLVQHLLSQGASPTEANTQGLTALLLASAAGYLPLVQWLLSEGGSSIGETAFQGVTALLLAAQRGHLSVVQHLVSQGASPIEAKPQPKKSRISLDKAVDVLKEKVPKTCSLFENKAAGIAGAMMIGIAVLLQINESPAQTFYLNLLFSVLIPAGSIFYAIIRRSYRYLFLGVITSMLYAMIRLNTFTPNKTAQFPIDHFLEGDSKIVEDKFVHHHLYGEDAGRILSSYTVNNIVVPGGVEFLHVNHYQVELSVLLQTHRVICIQGPAGSGKTTLAQAEAIRTDSLYALRFQIAAYSDESLFSGLGELYSVFYGVNEFERLHKEKSTQIKTEKLLGGLHKKIHDKEWYPALLLLDDCQLESTFLSQVIDTLTDVRFLVTTRNNSLFNFRKDVADLSLNRGWRLEERIHFLEVQLESSKALEGRQALANYLPYPLALKVAAQTIRHLRRTDSAYNCDVYLSDLRHDLSVDDEAQCTLNHDEVTRTPVNFDNVDSLDDLIKEKAFLERTLKLQEAHYDDSNHYRLAKTLTNLGNAYGSLGDAEKQRTLLEKALRIKEAYYGQDHYEVAITLTGLGNAYEALGDRIKMKALLERALAIQESHYGPDNYEVAITLINLGGAYGGWGELAKQRVLLERALSTQEADDGPYHHGLAITLTNLGNAYGYLGELKKTKALLERSLKIEEAHYGNTEHYQLAKTLTNLGNVYGALDDPEAQKILLERALKIKEAHYGPNHYEVATTLTNLGNAYGSLGDPEKKKALLEHALKLQEAHYDDPDHYQLAKTLTSLGNAYGSLGDLKAQKTLLERALKIEEAHYGPDHHEVAIVLFNLAHALLTLGHNAQAASRFLACYKIFERHYAADHQYTQLSYQHWQHALKQTLSEEPRSNRYGFFERLNSENERETVSQGNSRSSDAGSSM